MTEQERLREEWLILLEEDDWASAVRRRLGELGRTQEDLARYIEVPLSRINRHLRGVGRPDDREMKAVTRALAYWAKARYLSWHRVVDVLRPILSPRRVRRLALVPALAVLLALIPMPAGAQTTLAWGPGGTEMGASSPVYSQPIRVIDAMMGTLSDAHRRIWRRARDQALANWQLPFTVERRSEADLPYAWTDDNINAGLAITDIEPNAILLVRNRSIYCQNVGGWVETEQGGVAALCPWAPWWKDYYFSQLVGAIGHEVGHALGFGHGGNGIMGGGSDRPNAVELTALHAYWG